MPIKLTLLGLGRLNGSLALRLKANPDLALNGYDGNQAVAQQAVRQNYLRRSDWNLHRAAEGADVLIAELPFAELPGVLRSIGPTLRPGSVVAAFSPLLGPPLAWAEAAFGASSDQSGNGSAAGSPYFVAIHPALNPAQLHTGEVGLPAAREDLFERGLWALAPAPNCPPEALRLVADLAGLAGAAPYHMDPAEHDSLVAASEGLPALFACALLRAASASPGWDETRKVADRALATATAALIDADPAALSQNHDNLLRYLDAALVELNALRDLLAAGEQPAAQAALSQVLYEAATVRHSWRYDRQNNTWDLPESAGPLVPATGEMLGQLLLGKWGKPRK